MFEHREDHVKWSLIAGGAGTLAMLLVLKASVLPSIGESVSRYHMEQSLPAAKGANVVNVILVDFRALDTFGEITVLGIAALGVMELLRLRHANTPAPTASLLDPLRSLLAPILVLLAIILLWRGHNEPGGGFIGGLVAAAAFVLFGLADNERSARQALNFDTRTFIAAGLLLAGASALLPVLFGQPFLTGLWAELQLFGSEVELGSPIFFDLGVYLIVGTPWLVLVSG